MDSVACGAEETSGSDKFNWEWTNVLNERYQVATPGKCSPNLCLEGQWFGKVNVLYVQSK